MGRCECQVQVIDAGTLKTGRQSDWTSASVKRLEGRKEGKWVGEGKGELRGGKKKKIGQRNS